MLQTFGPSMLPTIDSKPSIFLAERITIRFGQVARGDIVIVRSPENPRKVVTKRIVGMEGDTVTYLPNPKYSANRKTVVVWSPLFIYFLKIPNFNGFLRF